MRTRRNKQSVSLPAQPGLTPEQQLVCVANEIKVVEHQLAELKQRQFELRKS
jgi:hypothetical protein